MKSWKNYAIAALLALPLLGAIAPKSDAVNCNYSRRVNVRSGANLNIRQTPGGKVIGSLRRGDYVTLKNLGKNGWVPISQPVQGFVSAKYLKRCQ